MHLQTQFSARNSHIAHARFNPNKDKSAGESAHCSANCTKEPTNQLLGQGQEQQGQNQAFERLNEIALRQSDLPESAFTQNEELGWSSVAKLPRAANESIDNFDTDKQTGFSSALQDAISAIKFPPGGTLKPIGPEVEIGPAAETELDDPWRDSTTPGVHSEVDGELYVGTDGDEIQHTDIQQRGLANCYFLAAVAAVAKANPDAIREMITDNGDGTYTVHFDGDLGDVTVDDDLLMNSSGTRPLGAQVENGSGDPELWVAIIEKAYAEGRGTYEDTEWDNIKTGMDDLLGEGTTKTQSATSFDPEDLDAALDSGSPMIANTYGSGSKKKYDDNGLVGSHVYAVLGYARDDSGNIRIGDDGKPMIELYNPWGHTEYADSEDSTNDGVFAMSWTEFQEKFRSVGVGEALGE